MARPGWPAWADQAGICMKPIKLNLGKYVHSPNKTAGTPISSLYSIII